MSISTYTGQSESDSITLEELQKFISQFKQNQAKTINPDDYFIAVNPGDKSLTEFFEYKGCLVIDKTPTINSVLGFDVYIDSFLPVGEYRIHPKLKPKMKLDIRF